MFSSTLFPDKVPRRSLKRKEKKSARVRQIGGELFREIGWTLKKKCYEIMDYWFILAISEVIFARQKKNERKEIGKGD